MRTLLTTVILLTTVGAALGQTPLKVPPEFYIGLDTNSKKCIVFDHQPKTDVAFITVATDAVYPTRAAAANAMKKLTACTSEQPSK